MPEAPDYVYRAIAPEWIDKSGRITADAFTLRPAEDELSVYSSSFCGPREVLKRLIDPLLARLATKSGDDRAKYLEWIKRKGYTVEDRIALGWRVARLPLSAFSDRGFEASAVEPDGHIGIRGAREEFERFSDVWKDLAVLVSFD